LTFFYYNTEIQSQTCCEAGTESHGTQQA